MVTMDKRYQRIGVEEHWVETVSRNLNSVDEFHPKNWPLEAYGDNYWSHVNTLMHVASGYYFADDLANARLWAEQTVRTAEDYFFGAWRQSMPDNPLRPEDDGYWARGGGTWVNTYRTSLAFALALDDWAAAQRLSVHPTEDKFDVNSRDRPWYLALAEYVAKGFTPLCHARLKTLCDQETKGHYELAEFLFALEEKRLDAVDHWFKEFFKYYRRYQKKRPEIQYQLAFDNSIMYHLARRGGHEIAMDELTRDHLIVFSMP